MRAKLNMVLQVDEAAVQATVTQLIDCLLRDTPGDAQTSDHQYLLFIKTGSWSPVHHPVWLCKRCYSVVAS